MERPLRAAIIGCGNIAAQYVETLKPYADRVALRGFADLDTNRAKAFAAKYGGRAYNDARGVLADDELDLVINLTIHFAHYEVTRAALLAGKHVFSEKPLAMSYKEAVSLLELASEMRRELCGAPTTFLGEAQQSFGKALREKRTGDPLLIYAAMNHGRIEEEHPNPRPFYDAGPLWDVGVYPLSVIAAFLGPFSRVESAFGRTLLPTRTTLQGESFTPGAPDCWIVVLRHTCGAILRLTVNFVVSGVNTKEEYRVEVHGAAGSLLLDSPFAFDAAVVYGDHGKPMSAVTPPRKAAVQVEWARAVVEMAEAIAEGRRPRAHASLAAHIVEVIEAMHTARAESRPVELGSTFTAPPLLPWAQ